MSHSTFKCWNVWHRTRAIRFAWYGALDLRVSGHLAQDARHSAGWIWVTRHLSVRMFGTRHVPFGCLGMGHATLKYSDVWHWAHTIRMTRYGPPDIQLFRCLARGTRHSVGWVWNSRYSCVRMFGTGHSPFGLLAWDTRHSSVRVFGAGHTPIGWLGMGHSTFKWSDGWYKTRDIFCWVLATQRSRVQVFGTGHAPFGWLGMRLSTFKCSDTRQSVGWALVSQYASVCMFGNRHSVGWVLDTRHSNDWMFGQGLATFCWLCMRHSTLKCSDVWLRTLSIWLAGYGSLEI